MAPGSGLCDEMLIPIWPRPIWPGGDLQLAYCRESLTELLYLLERVCLQCLLERIRGVNFELSAFPLTPR